MCSMGETFALLVLYEYYTNPGTEPYALLSKAKRQ